MNDAQIAKLVDDLVSQSRRYHAGQTLHKVFFHTITEAFKMTDGRKATWEAEHERELEEKKKKDKPMDNNKQAVDISGYRVLSPEDKATMNLLKALEAKILDEFTLLAAVPHINQRSLAIAKTEIQTGFMWANRAVARPNGE